MKEQIVIRVAAQDDLAAWQELWDGYNTFYGRVGETALPSQVTATTWARFFDADEPMHALVAERSGRLLGLAHFLFHRSTSALGPNCYLQDLFTVEESRGKGVGRALVMAVYEHAKSAGAARVYWQTHETNTIAMRLYDQIADKSGFIVYRKVW